MEKLVRKTRDKISKPDAPPASLPNSPDGEKGILSSCLKDPAVIPDVARDTPVAHFFNPVHADMYRAILVMWESGQKIDLITFTQHLINNRKIDKIGGVGYITEIQDFVPSAANVASYMAIVREKFILRQMVSMGLSLQRKAFSADADITEIIRQTVYSVERLAEASSGRNGAQRFDLDTLLAFDSTADPNCLVGNRYLVRGGTSLWCAGSGYGKSSLAIQLAVYWACGRRCFGLRPVRALKSLIIEAENDEGDMAEQLQGVIQGISEFGDLDVQASREQIIKNVGIYRAVGKTGEDFLNLLRMLIPMDRPDFVWIDPLFAFSGCDLTDAEKTGTFLRRDLFPIAVKNNVAFNVIHHIGKPVRDSNKDTNAGTADIDYQYLGFGTSEIQNSFRAVNILLPVRNTGTFKLVFSKRGERAGASDEHGNFMRSVYLQHSKKGICWLPADEPEKPAPAGAAKLKYTDEHVLESMSAVNGVSIKELLESLKLNCGMSAATFYRLWDGLKRTGKIKPDGEGKWIKKSKRQLPA